MELILKLKDESKLDALLEALRDFTNAEGVDLSVESLSRNPVLSLPDTEFNDEKWDEIMNRDKLRSDQPKMPPQEEEEWIAEQIREMRTEEKNRRTAQQAT